MEPEHQQQQQESQHEQQQQQELGFLCSLPSELDIYTIWQSGFIMQLSLFESSPLQQKLNRQLLYDLFQAYYNARTNKRNTKSALAFERNYESNLFCLYEEIINRKYKIKPSVCFINYSHVKREIFAADFRDRIVHHLIYNYISPVFERIFINDSYSCRTGKGTSYGINRLQYFIKSCSDNYNKPCFILKLDINPVG